MKGTGMKEDRKEQDLVKERLEELCAALKTGPGPRLGPLPPIAAASLSDFGRRRVELVTLRSTGEDAELRFAPPGPSRDAPAADAPAEDHGRR